MKKLLLLSILLVLALGCEPKGPKPFTIEETKIEPKTATYYKAVIGKCDGCDPNNPDDSKIVYTTEFEPGTERVFCFVTANVIKGTELKTDWYYVGKLVYEFPFLIEHTLPPMTTVNLWIEKQGGLPSGDYEVVLSMNGEEVDKLSFVIAGKTAKPVEEKKVDMDAVNNYLLMGAVACSTERYDLAIVNFNKVIELAPHNPEGYSNRGVAWMMKGDLDNAILDFNKALEIDPLNKGVYSNRGAVWHKKGDHARACSDWKKACELSDCDNYEKGKAKGWCE